MAGVLASGSASASSWEAKEDGVLLRDDEGQASKGSKVKLRSGRVLDTLTCSLSYSSAARRSTFLYLKERDREGGSEDKRIKKIESQTMYLLSLLSVLVFAKLP